ncbi:LEA type 2 family protein [Leptospira sp. 2 VSF19]|uniref:LEA type 2 family protein n=1 Tax=Leptospira soteropolitanensis TaxID=2950025 RepID=A0AAW5VKH3_9LEPT|nr:LEA type 2 family protein [Leptospira soteropolitanensis]MCW7492058.1 LEA type 2 family protein [Leptospira soteropolitanensis]MCW7499640.1 LEA type 2 family protein [Leptospira soteropolitanensis]MCW7521891.1 LEA type 2 family protein [Leptospira soteropolitanensis]MCW7525745.1 LEA type 2 family protein [Leptospira soteropolitanensis]MCW7530141.1 LEA type 2 family protein [Leptospira soteropolitanensis]
MKLALPLILSIFSLQCSVLGVIQDKIPMPEFEFDSLSIKSITFTEITLNIVTSVENPYPVSLPSSFIDMDIKIEGLKLSQVKTDLGAIEGKKTKQLPLEVKLKYTDLLNLYKKFPNKPLLEVSAEGNMKVPIPKGWQLLGKDSLSFPFVKKKEIPAILPNVEIQNFKILMPTEADILSASNTSALADTATGFLKGLLGGSKQPATSATKAGLSGLNLDINTEFDFVFANEAASNLNLTNLNYNLDLAGEKFLNGTPKEIINSGKTSTVKVATKFPITSISSSLYKTIQSKSAQFDLKGDSGLKVPSVQETIPFFYEKRGNFKW